MTWKAYLTFERYESYLSNDIFHKAVRSLVEEKSASKAGLRFHAQALLGDIFDKSESLQMSIFLQADVPDSSCYSVCCCQASIETENKWF